MTATHLAVRVEARGLEPVVIGPLTQTQADTLLDLYRQRDALEAEEGGGPTGRRITCEPYQAGDPDNEPLIPEGEERYGWISSAGFLAICVAALFFAFHTYHLDLSTPRLDDVPIAAGLAFIGAGGIFLLIGDAWTRAWGWSLRRWAREARRRRTAEVTS